MSTSHHCLAGEFEMASVVLEREQSKILNHKNIEGRLSCTLNSFRLCLLCKEVLMYA